MPVFRLDRIYARGLAIVDAHVHYAFPSGRISDHAALAATFETAGSRDEPVPSGESRRRCCAAAASTSRRWSARSTGAEREVWLETYIYADDDVGRDRHGGARPRGAARRHVVRRAGRRLGREALPDGRARGRARRRRRRRCSSTGPKSRRGSSARTGCGGCTASSATSTARIAFVGGINIIDDVNTPGQKPPRVDFALRIEGPLLVAIVQHDAARLGDQRARAVPAQRRAAVPVAAARAARRRADGEVRDPRQPAPSPRHRARLSRGDPHGEARDPDRQLVFLSGHPLSPRADRRGAARRPR